MPDKRLYLIPLVFILALALAGQAQTDDATLSAWWPLNEGSGTTVTDASGGGNDGTLTGGEWVPGMSKSGVYLDGVDDYIAVPNVLTETGTIAFWFKPDWDGTDPEDYRLFDASLGGIYFFISKGANHADINPEEFGFYLEDVTDADYQGIEFDPAGVIFADTWHHVAVTWEFDGGSAILYFDGQEMARADNIGGFPALDANPRFGFETFTYIPSANGAQAVIDEILVYSRVFAAEEIPLLMISTPAELAFNPSPADEATDVDRDGAMSWSAGEFAQTHDVYMGTTFEAVDTADRANPGDVLVSQGQADTAYDPGRLEFGQTYYWRIDEVNGAPDNTVHRGEVWSYTVEPLAYPVQNIVAISNTASDPGVGPDRTIDGSGMNELDQHSTESTDMWLVTAGAEPVYLQYEFDRLYKLHEMLVWNYNVMFEPLLGFGVKDVTIEYSADGADWTLLGDMELTQATAKSDYVANTAVDFAGEPVKFVKITVNSNRGGLPQYGLSEVRFLYIPAHAREPQPDDGATAVAVDTGLAWRAGREAAAHDVYLGTDAAALDLADTVATSSYAPANLEFGGTYYWKVDEVNEAEAISLWEGSVWTFATLEYALIDDMESYDDEDNRIFDIWLDGFVNDTGSTVGYFDAPFAEQTIVNSGRQSMPLEYANDAAPFYSEAELDLGSMDLDTNGADTLRLFFAGQAPSFLEAADGAILMNAIGNDIWGSADQFRYAYRQLTGDGSLTARVDAMDGSPSTWAKGGVMIRQSTDAGAINTCMLMTGGDGNGATYQQRMEPDTDSVSQHSYTDGPFAPPYWVRVTREGNTLQGYTSPDGENWTQRGDVVTLAMADPVLIGLALTSHNVDQATSAMFSNVAFTGSVSATWEVAEIGVAQPEGNIPEALYVALEDTSGSVAVVTHPEPGATALSGWNEWLIPYSDLAGVNLGRVARMYIGIGDRDNPTAGGAGMVFIDDVGYGHPAPVPPVNILANGGFEDGVMDPWSIYGDAVGEVVTDDSVEGSACLHITVNAAGANFWDAGLQHTGHVFEAGKSYTLSAWLKCSSGTLDINFKPEIAADPWTGYGSQAFTMTDQWQEFSVSTGVIPENVDPAAITFHIGYAAADFWVDDVRFYEEK